MYIAKEKTSKASVDKKKILIRIQLKVFVQDNKDNTKLVSFANYVLYNKIAS